jgi:putative transposase
MRMVHPSRERRMIFFVCYRFFKQLRDRYGSRKIVFTDGALWYNDACKWLMRLNILFMALNLNIMERFMQYLKDRTEWFDYHFPCRRKPDCDRQHVWNWLRLFMLYLSTGINRSTFTTLLIMDGG